MPIQPVTGGMFSQDEVTRLDGNMLLTTNNIVAFYVTKRFRYFASCTLLGILPPENEPWPQGSNWLLSFTGGYMQHILPVTKQPSFDRNRDSYCSKSDMQSIAVKLHCPTCDISALYSRKSIPLCHGRVVVNALDSQCTCVGSCPSGCHYSMRLNLGTGLSSLPDKGISSSSSRGYYLWLSPSIVMQLNWLYFCGISKLIPLKLWPNTAQGCNNQSTCMPQLQLLWYQCTILEGWGLG